MKSFRQIEAATLMNDAGVYSKTYARALLAATPKDQLTDPDKPKKIKGLDEDQMARMENEMESLQREYRLIEENYGKDVLNLTLTKGPGGTACNLYREVFRPIDRVPAVKMSCRFATVCPGAVAPARSAEPTFHLCR